MKPTIIEDSESDEDAIVTAKEPKSKDEETLKAIQNPVDNQTNKDDGDEDDDDVIQRLLQKKWTGRKLGNQ